MIGPTEVETPCRTYRGAKMSSGYGWVRRAGRNWYLHRWMWTRAFGPVPDGMFVLHRCDNPPCFRLSHLYLGTKKQNRLDEIARGRDPQVNKTHCPQGHEYTRENTYVGPKAGSGRQCKICRKDRW